jgi:flagellar hook-associated protein 2
MGTVGLNFGSPTSGQGFDVTETVSQIVTNLQKVETPWKNQLSTLQSQDTQLSSLGTLMSALSTDLSKLTDFTGILAQKMGSSSNNNVLQLTAATSIAAAGTHSVVVNSMATTSSGYLTEVASASDKLTGSIWLGVGNDTLHQVSVPSSGTLSSLAAAINSAGIGVSASVLTDTTGSRLSLVSSTSGADGNITIGSATSLADASGTVLGYAGSAGSGTSYSKGSLAAVAAAGDKLTGSISIQVGGGKTQTVTMASSGGTLQDLADAINNTSGIGVNPATLA